jgi:hypothetical protein
MAVTLEVNRKRIQRLMRILGIEALYPKPNLSHPPKPGRQPGTSPVGLRSGIVGRLVRGRTGISAFGGLRPVHWTTSREWYGREDSNLQSPRS